jgi:hypothetical protein
MLYMYADDTKIARGIHTNEDFQILQSDLDRLVQWSQVWQLHFNIDKCKTMHLGSRNIGMEYTMETKSGTG